LVSWLSNFVYTLRPLIYFLNFSCSYEKVWPRTRNNHFCHLRKRSTESSFFGGGGFEPAKSNIGGRGCAQYFGKGNRAAGKSTAHKHSENGRRTCDRRAPRRRNVAASGGFQGFLSDRSGLQHRPVEADGSLHD